MKHTKKLLALILAAALALLMLTACGGGGTTPAAQNYGEIVETAMNQARRQYGLSEVTLEESLTEPARKEYNREVNGWQYVTIDGQKYRVVCIQSRTMETRGMEVTSLKSTYCTFIESHRNSTASYITNDQEYAGVENLTHVGLWTGTPKNGLIDFCVVGTIPA